MEIKYKVSVVILNYKKPDMTLECVDYLQKSVAGSDVKLELIIVDNSAGETGDILNNALPDDAILINNHENLGFAKANNQGIQKATGEYLLLLNNDIYAKKPFIQQGISYLETHSDVAVWAPKLVGLDERMQVSASRLPSIKSMIHAYLTSKIGKNLGSYKESRQWDEPREVDAVIGAAMLIPMPVIKKIGMLDDDFFFTSEDIEFCKRIKVNGMKVVYDPTIDIVHIGSASQSHEKWIDDPFLHKGRILYFKKTGSLITYLAVWSIITFGLKKKRLDHWIDTGIKKIRSLLQKQKD